LFIQYHITFYPDKEPEMNEPTLFGSTCVSKDVFSINSYIPVPGFGVLPVNAFLLQAAQPILIDTGLAALGKQFQSELYKLINPEDLHWIWITHTDPDHLGSLTAILEDAPQARIVTTYLGMGKMGMLGVPLERVYLLNPGQSLDVGDRKLLAVSPPTYDAPETCALFDSKQHTLFSADCFGALMHEPAETALQIRPDTLREGCINWATVDSPWLESIDTNKFDQKLSELSKLNAATVLSSHLPPAHGICNELLNYLRDALERPRFIGPDQTALENMLAA
jgi:hypothetical protein